MNRKADFIKMLITREDCEAEIISFLLSEHIISEEDKLRYYSDRRSNYDGLLSFLGNKKLALVHYKWQLLPEESYSLTVVANNNVLEINSSR